jgi:4-hydroxy-4-methyl-2-oxoglutarate aldolase
VRGTIKASVPSVGQPVLVTGVLVAAGDLVVADDDGVVVLPSARTDNILAAGEARAQKEADFMARLARGETTVDLLGLSAWRERA